jgi:hypothetical protein
MMQMMRGQLSNPSGDAGALPLLNLFSQPPAPAPAPKK